MVLQGSDQSWLDSLDSRQSRLWAILAGPADCWLLRKAIRLLSLSA